MEVGLDVGSMATDDGSCCIIEVMGRSAGWIAGGHRARQTRQAGRRAAYHSCCRKLPFDEEAFLAKVKETVDSLQILHRGCGRRLEERKAGEEIGADKSRLDAFGHPVLSGAAEKLKEFVQGKLNMKTRTVKLGYAQRAAAHLASATDVTNAFACGEAAVQAAVDGKSGFMVKIVRNVQPDGPIKWSTDLQPLDDIANVEHFIPRDWISEDGFLPNEKFVEYARPLIEGESLPPMEGGLPKFITLQKAMVRRSCTVPDYQRQRFFRAKCGAVTPRQGYCGTRTTAGEARDRRYTIISRITSPETSVRRKSRPA